jgi:hypothetical protein
VLCKEHSAQHARILKYMCLLMCSLAAILLYDDGDDDDDDDHHHHIDG